MLQLWLAAPKGELVAVFCEAPQRRNLINQKILTLIAVNDIDVTEEKHEAC